MTIKGGTSQACAACKYQRRKCSKECPLAPYFPADQPEKFQHAHRLFGVRNIMSILKQVRSEQQQDAMKSIIYESAMRAQFPVSGCLGIINQLQSELQQTLEELRYVHTSLAICRDHAQQQIPIPSSDYLQLATSKDHYSDPNIPIQQPYNNNNSNNIIINYNNNHGGVFPNHHEFLANEMRGMYISTTAPHEDDGQENINYSKPMIMKTTQNPSFNNEGEPLQLEPNLLVSQDDQYPNQQELDVCYDDIPFDTIGDDRQSNYMDSKEACESSAESSFKNITQNEPITKNELHLLV